MAEAFALVRSLDALMRRNRGPHSEWAAESHDAFDEQTERGRALVSELRVLGAGKSSAAYWRVLYLQNIRAKARDRSGADTLDGKNLMQLRSDMTAAFETDLTGEAPPNYRAAAVVTPHY